MNVVVGVLEEPADIVATKTGRISAAVAPRLTSCFTLSRTSAGSHSPRDTTETRRACQYYQPVFDNGTAHLPNGAFGWRPPGNALRRTPAAMIAGASDRAAG